MSRASHRESPNLEVMAFAFMINRLKTLALLLIGVIKRALCCFRRRRRASCDPVPLTAIGIISNQASVSEEMLNADLQSWTSWDESPMSIVTEKSIQNNAIQQQIEMYRQQIRRKNSEEEANEAQLDLFEDMTPCITRQMKVFLQDAEDESSSSRLSLQMDPVLYTSPDLETWEDTAGWEDQTQEEWDPEAILKEKRRLERQRRLAEQHQKRQEREQSRVSRPLSLGARLS